MAGGFRRFLGLKSSPEPVLDAAPVHAAPPPKPSQPPKRKIVSAPVLAPEEERTGWTDEIRIKARIDSKKYDIVFLVDRPVLTGCSFWCPDQATADTASPLAAALFALGNVQSLLIHEMTVTVTPSFKTDDWAILAPFARDIGAALRKHLKNNAPVLAPQTLAAMPSEEEFRQRLQQVIDETIQPGIAMHGGSIAIDQVKGNTVYVSMGGGCKGCAGAATTLREGVERLFRQTVPEMGALLDATDHASGCNPFFKPSSPSVKD